MAERVLLAEGREAEVFLLPDGNVLKLMRDPGHRSRLEREAAACAALIATGVAAPTIVDIVTIDGRPGLVMLRLEGENLLARLGRAPLSVLKAGALMGRAHAAIHDIVAPTALPELHTDLRERINDAPMEDGLRAAALAMLDALPRGDRLCHGDLHLGNLIGSWAAYVIIDWGDAARGDPTADVARTELLHRLGDPAPGTPAILRALAPLGRGVLVARYLSAYRTHHQIDSQALERWRVVRAAARLSDRIDSESTRLLGFLHKRLDPGH